MTASSNKKSFQVGSATFGDGRLTIIAGPCVIESAEHAITMARECAERGYWVSFAGNVTYPKNEHLRQAAAALPPGRILTETDSPFLSPQKMRGSDNAPANVVITMEALARARDESVEALTTLTARNARTAFPGLR